MKTLSDLFALIALETALNEGKLLHYQFSIDTHYSWCCMYEFTDAPDIPEKKKLVTVFNHLDFKTPESLQLVYWTIYHRGRSGKSKN